jgi:hypothetical protein
MNNQISLEGRKTQLDARIYNTIASSATSPSFVSLIYDKTGPSSSLSWDYNHFYRAAQDAVVRYFNSGMSNDCTHANVPTCDSAFSGSHSNSISTQSDPLFGPDGRHLTTASPGWQTGKRPSTISGLSGVTIFVADNSDNEGTARSQGPPAEPNPEMGAFENEAGGC